MKIRETIQGAEWEFCDSISVTFDLSSITAITDETLEMQNFSALIYSSTYYSQ